MSASLRQDFLDKATAFGQESALRCLALAYRQMAPGTKEVNSIFSVTFSSLLYLFWEDMHHLVIFMA